MVFTPTLLTFYEFLNNTIETFIHFSKHLVDLIINIGLAFLENRFGKLREYEIIDRMVNDTYICHGPVPVVENKYSLRIDTYLLKVIVLDCSVD